MEVSCRHCGAAFRTYPCLVRDGRGLFCSRSCRDAARSSAARDPDYIATRLWQHIATGPGCWEWQLSCDQKGYGQITLPGHLNRAAHRLAWEFTYGPIPDNLSVLHHCDNPRCCRPDHLFLGTVPENNWDMFAKGRGNRTVRARGEAHGQARLTMRQAEEIRTAYRTGVVSQRTLAARYGVSQSTISHLLRGLIWTA